MAKIPKRFVDEHGMYCWKFEEEGTVEKVEKKDLAVEEKKEVKKAISTFKKSKKKSKKKR